MWLGWDCVQDTGPHEATGEVDDCLDVLLVSLNVGRDLSLLFGDTPLLWLTVDGREALVAPGGVLVTLNKDEHVLPIRVDYRLE